MICGSCCVASVTPGIMGGGGGGGRMNGRGFGGKPSGIISGRELGDRSGGEWNICGGKGNVGSAIWLSSRYLL